MLEGVEDINEYVLIGDKTLEPTLGQPGHKQSQSSFGRLRIVPLRFLKSETEI